MVEGAGAFVCGEETALIASLEGRSGRPRPRPALPRAEGPLRQADQHQQRRDLVQRRADRLQGRRPGSPSTGSAKSAGTKVFSLVGKVKSTGLVEMPLGTPLAKLIYDIGEAAPNGRDIKAVQTGGPSGGCIPADMFDTPVDYETLAQIGSIMGSGGMVVMDEDNCMVDVARYFIEFTHSESCGKCVPCRVGLDKALRILNRITTAPRPRPDTRVTGRAVPDGPRHLAVRPRPERPEPGADDAAPLPPRVRGPHPRPSAAAPASARTSRSARARTPARCT